jgi:hypothetical protein
MCGDNSGRRQRAGPSPLLLFSFYQLPSRVSIDRASGAGISRFLKLPSPPFTGAFPGYVRQKILQLVTSIQNILAQYGHAAQLTEGSVVTDGANMIMVVIKTSRGSTIEIMRDKQRIREIKETYLWQFSLAEPI